MIKILVDFAVDISDVLVGFFNPNLFVDPRINNYYNQTPSQSLLK